MKQMPISECEICRKLPAQSRANLLNNETLPKSAYRLKHGRQRLTNPPDSVEWRVECPLCGRYYAFSCDKGFLKWDLYLRRMRSGEPLESPRTLTVAKDGRLVIPILLMKELGFAYGDAFLVQRTKTGITLKKI